MPAYDPKVVVPTTDYGSVHNVPRLPEGFRDTFESYIVDTGRVRLHAVIGGSGKPLLLLGGWPQCWYAWRYLMLPLSRDFTVIAVDSRGVGLSEKAADGYDSASLSSDIFALMDTLGYERFTMVGHDVGMWTGYAMVADHPERFEKIALGEAIIPGVSPSPPLLSEDRKTNDFLSHFNFNRVEAYSERLVEGREDIYFGFHLSNKAATPDALPVYARDFYIEQLRRVPGALKSSFQFYRAIGENIQQNKRRIQKKIAVPMLAFAGDLACGELVEKELKSVAQNVQSVILAGCGHFVAEEKPEELLQILRDFLLESKGQR